MSDKESPEVGSTNDEEVEITNVVIAVNVKHKTITDEVKSFDTLADHLQEVMVESLPIMVDTHIKEQVKKQVPEQVRDQVLVYVAEGLILERQKTKEEMERMIAKAILQERGRNLLFSSSSNIFDSVSKIYKDHRRHKDKVGMQIPDWMITKEMKHTKHYRMYAEVFGLDVPLTQSQPTESTQGTHRTPSAPRSPTHKKDTTESSAPKRSTVIHFRLPKRRSTRLTPPVPVPTVEKVLASKY
ncbi:hypothetical protein Tco_0646611 [Tanacetum coccineum]